MKEKTYTFFYKTGAGKVTREFEGRLPAKSKKEALDRFYFDINDEYGLRKRDLKNVKMKLLK